MPNSTKKTDVVDSINHSSVDFRPQMDVINNTKMVKFIFVVPYSEHFSQMDESTLKKFGCSYVTQNSARIAEIVELLNKAKIRYEPNHEGSWESRNGVFLTSENGTETKFLFDQHYQYPENNTVQGELNEKPITANSSLLEDLYRWAAKLDSNTACEFFISKYR